MAKAKIFRRMVLQSVTVVRDGKRKPLPINESFDFNEDEIEYLDRVSPGATRKIVSEGPVSDEPEQEAVAEPEPAKKAPAKKAAAKKAPTKADDAADESEDDAADESEDDDI